MQSASRRSTVSLPTCLLIFGSSHSFGKRWRMLWLYGVQETTQRGAQEKLNLAEWNHPKSPFLIRIITTSLDRTCLRHIAKATLQPHTLQMQTLDKHSLLTEIEKSASPLTFLFLLLYGGLLVVLTTVASLPPEPSCATAALLSSPGPCFCHSIGFADSNSPSPHCERIGLLSVSGSFILERQTFPSTSGSFVPARRVASRWAEDSLWSPFSHSPLLQPVFNSSCSAASRLTGAEEEKRLALR